ncbi:D-galactarolactone cycloisomerase [Candidatus Entotheonellaceae bacterium PAL068K]
MGLYGVRELIPQEAVDIVQPDLDRAGGFTKCRRIAVLAQAYNLMVAPHAFSLAITLVASMHLLALICNSLILKFDQNSHVLRQELLVEPIRADQEGFVALPGRPDFGANPAPGTVERYRTSVS